MNTIQDVYTHYRTRHLKSDNTTLWDYLESLGLNPDVVTAKLCLGVADRSIHKLLPSRTTQQGKKVREHLMETNILKDTGFENLTGLVIPFYDGDKLVNLYSYSYRAQVKMANNLNDDGVVVFGEGSRLILLEEPLDLLVLGSFNLEGYQVAYTNNLDLLPDNLERIYVLKHKESLSTPQYKIHLPSKDTFIEIVRHQIITEADILLLLDSAKPISGEVKQPDVKPTVEFTHRDNHYFVNIHTRRYRVTGIERNTGYHSLKVTVKVWIDGEGSYYMDALDLCSDKNRTRYQRRAAEELGVACNDLKYDFGKLLLTVESIQDARLSKVCEDRQVELTPKEITEATEFLTDPNLIQNIQRDFGKCGMVGEDTNRILGYLTATSRLLERPLGILIQSSSSAGKTSIQKSILKFMPPEDVLSFSTITPQSLYYMNSKDLKSKILAVAEMEGSNRAAYALKLLVSDGELKIASVGKDDDTGATTTQQFKVTGQISLNMTTTSLSIDPELENRLITVCANESVEQTQKIHDYQRYSRTLEGMRNREVSKKIINKHQNAQRLLKSYPVVNPFIEQLEFDVTNTRSRRDFSKLISLVDAVTILHQYQREIIIEDIEGDDVEFLVSTQQDIEVAKELAKLIFQNSTDELPAQTRKVWGVIENLITEGVSKTHQQWHEIAVTRRRVRELCGSSMTMIKTHMDRLVESEYLKIVTGHNGSRFTYSALVEPIK